MKTWNKRPIEIRNLFNPAFCGVILLRAFHGFEEDDDAGMPFSLALLILPLCLYKDSRELIPKTSSGYLLKTISDNPKILVGFAGRTRCLLPYTLEALGFTMELGSFEVTEQGRLKMQEKGIRKKIDGTPESIKCQRAARIVGKQFAKISDRITIYSALGIRP